MITHDQAQRIIDGIIRRKQGEPNLHNIGAAIVMEAINEVLGDRREVTDADIRRALGIWFEVSEHNGSFAQPHWDRMRAILSNRAPLDLTAPETIEKIARVMAQSNEGGGDWTFWTYRARAVAKLIMEIQRDES